MKELSIQGGSSHIHNIPVPVTAEVLIQNGCPVALKENAYVRPRVSVNALLVVPSIVYAEAPALTTLKIPVGSTK